MKVNFYTQSQTRFQNIGKKKSQSIANKPNNSNLIPKAFESTKAFPAQFSLINFTGGLKTNYIKEILEQPKVLKNLLDKYFSSPGKVSNLDLELSRQDLKKISGIKIIASGSSKNVAEMSRDFIEEVSEIPVDVYYASEFAHKKIFTNKKDLMIFISQSGETADTFAALKKTNLLNIKSIALTNTPESKIHKNASTSVEVGAGKELAVAATKSVTAQLINMYAIGLKLAEIKGSITPNLINNYVKELKSIPDNLEKMLKDTKIVKEVAKNLVEEKNMHILGRGANHGSAMEGALKLRETTYSNPTPSASGEFLHGYIASVDETTPVIQIIQGKKGDENFDLAYGNLKEIIKKRNPEKIVVIKDKTNKEIEKEPLFIKSNFIDIPAIYEKFSPVYVVSRFQMLANELTKLQGKNPDKPRSLTKAVLSE